MRKPVFLLLMVLTLILTLGQSVGAFSDTGDNANADKIDAMQEMGLLQGEMDGTFNPEGQLTYAAGISLIVRSFDLNIDNIRFIKEPKATDSFPNLKNDAWYSQSFIIAALNGLDVPKDVKADQPMTREQFAHHLYKAIAKKGDYAFIMMYVVLKDEADVNPAYMDSIQKLLVSNIVTLNKDQDQMFYPKDVITRGDAAGWVYNGIKFVEKQAETPPAEPAPLPSPLTAVKLEVKAVSDKINEVTVSAQAPHPGYGIRVSSIIFDGANAVIEVAPVLPDPGKMYPQVITEVKTTTYVSSDYTAVLADTAMSSADTGNSSSSEGTPALQP